MRVSGAIALVLAAIAVGSSQGAELQKAPCNLVPQLRDVTINQGVGAYTNLVNGKETLARFYLSKPSCAGSGASIQVTGGSLTVRNGGATLGTIQSPTPAPSATAPPEIATYDAAAMADSTGDPKFVIPPNVLTQAGAFTATFAVTINYRQRSSRTGTYANGTVTFTNRPGTNSPIAAGVAGPSNPLSVLFVPMGDATKTYSSQWSSTAQQNVQDGMTAALARGFPLPAGIGDIGSTGGLRYSVTPTLLDLSRLGLLTSDGKFCGTGASYDAIKAQLAQFRLSHNTANPNAQANRVVGVVDPAIGLGPPNPCFEGMAMVNSTEAWALAMPGKAGQLIGLEVAHTLGLTPPSRENPFDGAHSQNVLAENPSVNRRFNLVERAFLPSDRSLLKPSATSPTPSNTNTLLEVPDYSFLHCVFGGPTTTECQTYGPGTVSATAPVAAGLSFVMSGTTAGENGLSCTPSTSLMCTGSAQGTTVVESYFASDVPQTAPSPTSEYRLVQRDVGGGIVSNQGVPVSFFQSGHGNAGDAGPQNDGVFALALPFQTQTERIELWKGAPGAASSLLLYARNRTQAPVVESMTVGGEPITLLRRAVPSPKAATGALLATFTVTNTNDAGPGSLRQAITDANETAGNDAITIDLDPDPTGVVTIAPTTPLPVITESVDISAAPSHFDSSGFPYVRLDGSNFGTTCTGTPLVNGLEFNIPSASTSSLSGLAFTRWTRGNAAGIRITGTGLVTVTDTLVGTDQSGASGLGNYTGIHVSNGSTIGGTDPGSRNVISGNCLGGVSATGSGAIVQGNWIGVGLDGTTALPNARGVFVQATNITIGGTSTSAGNRIRGNSTDGVEIISGSSGVTVRHNEIDGNGLLGIDLGPNGVTENDALDADTGANGLQNFPVLSGATSTTVSGTLDSAPDQTFTIDVYASPACDSSGNGEGPAHVGSFQVTTNGSGNATFTNQALSSSASGVVTAAATDVLGNTSEFSDCVTVSGGGDAPQDGPTFVVNTNFDGAPATVGCTTTECTLREAIVAANADEGANTIQFDIAGETQIALDDPLPQIADTVLIDGLSQPEGTIVINGDGAGAEVDGLELAAGSSGSEIRGLEIRDFFSGAGIRVSSADNTIASNTIHDVGDGIVVAGSGATGNVIGADVGPSELSLIDDALGNVLVEASGDGLEIRDGAASTVVAGNYVGTDRTDATTRGNDGAGIRVVASSGNQLGPGNTITRNGTAIGTGIRIQSGSGNRVVANSIHDNFGEGIGLNAGANGDLPRPALTSALSSGSSTIVSGTVAAPNGTYFVELFRNGACDSDGVGFGEGEAYLDFANVSVTDGSEPFTKSVAGLAPGDVVTATLTSTSTNNTSEFSNCETVEEAVSPEGQEPVEVTATDDNPEDNTLDLYLDCGSGKPKQVIAVGLRPDTVGATSASWSTNYDSTLAPPSCVLQAVVMDGFTRSGFTATGTETVSDGPNPLVAAISSPRQNATFLQYSLIPLRGSIRNAQGELSGGDLDWTVDGPGSFTRTGTGKIVDLQPPTTGGWPIGQYTATLTKPGSTEASATDTVQFTVLADADNDGIPKSVDEGCLGGSDEDPLNAFTDTGDSDGIPNADDPQPCVAANSYTAVVTFNPDPLPTGSSGSPVTIEVRVPYRNVSQVVGGTVRITTFAGKDVSTDPRFANTAWTVDKRGVGIAKFDRLKLIQFLSENDIHNRVVAMTISGNAPTWSFEGSDTFFVQG